MLKLQDKINLMRFDGFEFENTFFDRPTHITGRDWVLKDGDRYGCHLCLPNGKPKTSSIPMETALEWVCSCIWDSEAFDISNMLENFTNDVHRLADLYAMFKEFTNQPDDHSFRYSYLRLKQLMEMLEETDNHLMVDLGWWELLVREVDQQRKKLATQSNVWSMEEIIDFFIDEKYNIKKWAMQGKINSLQIDTPNSKSILDETVKKLSEDIDNAKNLEKGKLLETPRYFLADLRNELPTETSIFGFGKNPKHNKLMVAPEVVLEVKGFLKDGKPTHRNVLELPEGGLNEAQKEMIVSLYAPSSGNEYAKLSNVLAAALAL